MSKFIDIDTYKLNHFEYCGVKTIHYSNEDEGEVNESDIIVDKTEILVDCVNQMKNKREEDIKTRMMKHHLNDDIHFSVSYWIAIYKYKESGVSKWELICKDYYNLFDEEDEKIETEKGVFYDIESEEKTNISKIVSNCKNSDKKKLNWVGNGKLEHIGDITYNHIYQLLQDQNYKCYLCNDFVFTHSYVPYCSYKFSVDRVDNNKPHDDNNVKISCYFCNCKNHVAYNRSEKNKCVNEECICNKDYYNI
jgi:hypothetical protein